MEQRIDLIVGRPDSLDQLIPLFRAYQAHYNQFSVAGEEQTRCFLSQILRSPNEGFVILASTSGQMIGFATGYVMVSGLLEERMIHLGDLYVDPGYRGRKVGTSLVLEVVSQARLRGFWPGPLAFPRLERVAESLV